MQRLGKWRPALWTVLGGALLGTLALSFAGLVALRYLGPDFGFRRAALGLAVLIGLATLCLGALLVRLLLRPITALSRQASDLRQGTRDLAPLPHYGTRELRDLGLSVTAMAAALQNREASVRTFTDHATHELKTPVSAIRIAAELLSDTDLPDADRRLVAQILGAAGQMEAQLDALRRVTAAREPGHDGTSTLAEVLPGLQADHPMLQIDAAGAETPLPLAASGLRIVLGHLAQNAVQHGATMLMLTAEPAALTITDNGSGVSDGNAHRIFAPFFTTQRETGGTGMGLTIAENLLRAHNATIRLAPSTVGARFVITFAGED